MYNKGKKNVGEKKKRKGQDEITYSLLNQLLFMYILKERKKERKNDDPRKEEKSM
ncbi:hypothetical protein WN55_11382 [Dufourea novaeangliae]|uniref:Uncharacterized protein n=1 Tax=Dufourea novaeangliae TaxID=178035 RepID=A0A154PAF2_DUFNO|nr:hypothetical protein WN55_11382 [Dufourea novaeangliae]